MIGGSAALVVEIGLAGGRNQRHILRERRRLIPVE
jgi:hypothetical protein